ncbi:MAG: glycosyltransferase family 2 protein [Pseudomonadota bacterium]
MRWGTVTLADEPIELLLAFAAWHRHIGASEIHIFLDRPDEDAAALLARIPGVIVTQCDELFWAANGGRKNLQTQRQATVANFAYAETAVDWLAHIDADEFLYQEHDMVAELSAMPDGIDAAQFSVRERVWVLDQDPKSIFDGVFRVPVPGKLKLNRHIAETNARFTSRGLVGHTSGKCITRTRRGIKLGIHSPENPDELYIMESRATRLLHFDGLTPFHWLIKRLRYASLPHAEKMMDSDNYRWAQIAHLRETPEIWKARRFARHLTTLSQDRIKQLHDMRLIEDAPEFRPSDALQSFLPDKRVNLSVSRFDRHTQRRHSSFAEAIRLEPGET